ncbi:Uncharacterised protein [Plesiomonas shigelloides]|uniref:ABC-three component system protein n=1 Tax=Plesiomonas shigelloides TaxID=703 RepID=UPI000DFBA82B|nr:ABC-three component system protein [Plesiomonas shigelloides]SUB63853.1 Uncharacterised protein [Plesiomonas shigelloides]
MAFDASPSWSGFNYQGKVALYYALKQINSMPVGSDFSNHSLMLEDNEDFEIRLDGSPVSFHQVKAYNSSSYSKYSDALLEISLELYKKTNVIGRIHTWKSINFKANTQSLIDSIKDDIIKIIEQFENQAHKDGSSILEKAASSENNIPKQASILRTAFKEETQEQLCVILKAIVSGENNALSRLNSYRYDDGNYFCELNEINSKILSEIDTYLASRNIITTLNKTKKTFYFFLGLMDEYITHRHQTKQHEDKIQITFNEIINSLEIDHEDIGQEYLIIKFKEAFFSLIDEYMTDPDEGYQEPIDGQSCNLQEAKRFLLTLTPQQLWEHYRSFCPHTYLEHDNNSENALATDMNGIRYVLIRILHEINFERASHNSLRRKFTYSTTSLPRQTYLPTTITTTARITQIERKITENPSMSEILYEVENLIYSGVESYSFSPSSMRHTEAPLAEDEEPRSKREDVLKTITLVPISTAKDALT